MLNPLILILHTMIAIMSVKDALSFPPNILTGDGVHSKSHKDILNKGLRKACGQFVRENGYLENNTKSMDPYNILNVFFQNDSHGLKKYISGVDEIYTSLEEQEASEEAYLHCNAEQFLAAHIHIIFLRQTMRELANESEPNLPLIRDYIGKCLYTLQAFYSSSNWIEMEREQIYSDFGVPGKTLIPVADENIHTCSDCDNTGNTEKHSCRNNLLVKDLLTSGYHGKQNVQAPYRDITASTGKCGFGGSSDIQNGHTTAKGGINKDRNDPTYSPHYYLHYAAYFAAREATYQFIIDKVIGIINELGVEVFADVFNLHKRTRGSLGFAIDVTGSMGDDIARVRAKCTDIVTTLRGSSNEPLEYVLTTFSDPVDLNKHVLTTVDGFEMITKIENLTVDGGGDAPEYSMDGLQKCIDQCRAHSTIVVFTDAPAKDEDRKVTVLDAALKKNITVNIVRTDYSARRKRRTGRTRRAAELSAYDFIAENTHGKVYRITTQGIATAMDEIVEKGFPASTSVVDTFSWQDYTDDLHYFNLDKSAQNIKIQIIGAIATSEVEITTNSESLMDLNATQVVFEDPDKVLVSVMNPSPGEYTITRKTARLWKVNITTQSVIDFEFHILEQYANDYWKRIPANPIIDRQYTLEIMVFNLPANASISNIVLMDLSGNRYNLTIAHVLSDYSNTIMFTNTTFSSKIYFVSIYGFDEDGNVIQRTSWKTIYPVSVQLKWNMPLELRVGTRTIIPYEVHNTGSTIGRYLVTFVDNRGFVTSNNTNMYTLTAGESVTAEMNIQVTTSYKTVYLSIQVQDVNTGTVLQMLQKVVFISTDKIPQCLLQRTIGSCNGKFYGDSCSSVKWFGQTTLTFDTEIATITGTIGLQAEIGNLTLSPVTVNVSGNCCSPYGFITIIDTNKNMQRCYYDLGKPFFSESDDNVNLGIVIGSSIAGMCIIIAAILIWRFVIKSKIEKQKIHDVYNIFPGRSDKISKRGFKGRLMFDF